MRQTSDIGNKKIAQLLCYYMQNMFCDKIINRKHNKDNESFSCDLR